MSSKNKTDLLTGILLQIFWPFGGFLFSFNKVFKEQTTLIYILLAGFYGFVFIPTAESDMVRYLDEFERLARLDFFTILDDIKSGAFSDYYTVTLSYLVSFFTYNPQIYLAIASMIFANFYIKSIKLILQRFPIQKSFLSTIAIIIIYFYVPIFFINGLRFYTAFYVFFYGLIKVFFYNEKKYYLLAFITPLIHVSFLATVSILVLFALFGKYRNAAYALLVLSISTSLLSFDFSSLSGNSKAQEKIINYTSTESISNFYEDLADMRSQTNAKYKIYESISDLHFYVVLFVFILIFVYKTKLLLLFDNFNPKLINLNIFFLSLYYFMQNVPESYRFKHIFVLLFLISMLIVLSLNFSSVFLRNSVLLLVIGLIPYELSLSYVSLTVVPSTFYFSNWLTLL